MSVSSLAVACRAAAIWYRVGEEAAGSAELKRLTEQFIALAGARDAAHALLGIAADLGGALSGEHGIGAVKLDGAATLDPAVLAAQRAVKDALDPAGIMNPGRKIPPA